MTRALLSLACLSALVALWLYARADVRAPGQLDLQGARRELALAVPPSRLVTTTDRRDVLLAKIREVRSACPRCTVLGVNPDHALLELAPELAARWSEADSDAIRGRWVVEFLRYGDVGGAARAFVRQYVLRLERDGLVEPSPHGELAPLSPPDRKRVQPRASNSGAWGAALAASVALFAWALSSSKPCTPVRARPE